MNREIKNTPHPIYRCQYHIVFAPKYKKSVTSKYEGQIWCKAGGNDGQK